MAMEMPVNELRTFCVRNDARKTDAERESCMGKISLYWNTVKNLKPGQIYYRIGKILKRSCTLGVRVSCSQEPGPVAVLTQLDFDPSFLQRFPLEALMEDRIVILHEAEKFNWDAPWKFENRSALWNYNLHYFEFLFPLIKAWLDTGEHCYLNKIKQMIQGWIRRNPRENGGAGWDPYPTSLRLVNWISCYGYLEHDLEESFRQQMLFSMKEQYANLAAHLEKHLLGNHYFENLKTLVICSIFFQNPEMTEAALRELKKQCAEQILPDGMHFELSPMYHKIILEDMLRTAAVLRQAERKDGEIEQYLQPMIDASYSLEEGLERIPLFNDCGNNVAKSLETLVLVAKDNFDITPQYKSQLPDSGYSIFKIGDWKMIVDAGQPGPKYLPGHAHCDAMSFELFHRGRPVLVNCGTYAYQCAERGFFRSTAAHNTVIVNDTEQSQCWSAFRMAKGSKVQILQQDAHGISMKMTDYRGHTAIRKITICGKKILISDTSEGKRLRAFYHFAEDGAWNLCCGTASWKEQMYAADYGWMVPVKTLMTEGEGNLLFEFEII